MVRRRLGRPPRRRPSGGRAPRGPTAAARTAAPHPPTINRIAIITIINRIAIVTSINRIAITTIITRRGGAGGPRPGCARRRPPSEGVPQSEVVNSDDGTKHQEGTGSVRFVSVPDFSKVHRPEGGPGAGVGAGAAQGCLDSWRTPGPGARRLAPGLARRGAQANTAGRPAGPRAGHRLQPEDLPPGSAPLSGR